MIKKTIALVMAAAINLSISINVQAGPNLDLLPQQYLG